MGGALAARLQVSQSIVAYDRSKDAVRELTMKGARAAASADEVASCSDIIFLCLPTSDDVRAVLSSDISFRRNLRRGAMIVDQTTGDPNVTRALATELAEEGVDLIDAPVSGGRQGAEAGTIAIMVGAAPAQFDRVLPTLQTISPNIFHAGGVGAGQVVKLVNNLMSTAQRLLSFEAVTLAAKNGVDPRKTVEVLMASGGRNAYLEKIMGPRVLNGKLDIGFTLGLAHKDVRLACALARSSNAPSFFGDLTQQLYQACIEETGRDSQVDTVGFMFDRIAGTHVVPVVNDLPRAEGHAAAKADKS
jgi:3-hydroxyisobutyrate dehydrogenase